MDQSGSVLILIVARPMLHFRFRACIKVKRVGLLWYQI